MCHLVKFYISDTAWFSSIALITFDLTSLFGTAITDSLSLYLLHLNVKFWDVSLNVKFWDILSRLKCGWWLWLNLVLCWRRDYSICRSDRVNRLIFWSLTQTVGYWIFMKAERLLMALINLIQSLCYVLAWSAVQTLHKIFASGIYSVKSLADFTYDVDSGEIFSRLNCRRDSFD